MFGETFKTMNKDQKDKVIKSLKTGRVMGGGQSFRILQKLAGCWASELSSFLQSLRKKGLVTYFASTSIWYWNDDVSTNDLF